MYCLLREVSGTHLVAITHFSDPSQLHTVCSQTFVPSVSLTLLGGISFPCRGGGTVILLVFPKQRGEGCVAVHDRIGFCPLSGLPESEVPGSL